MILWITEVLAQSEGFHKRGDIKKASAEIRLMLFYT